MINLSKQFDSINPKVRIRPERSSGVKGNCAPQTRCPQEKMIRTLRSDLNQITPVVQALI